MSNNEDLATCPRPKVCASCTEAGIIAYERQAAKPSEVRFEAECGFAPVLNCTFSQGTTPCNECVAKGRYCNVGTFLHMDGDCVDFNVLSTMVWGLLRKKVDDCTGQSPNPIFIMTIASRARIGAAYYEYAKVYVEALRLHLKEHGLYGHSVKVPDAIYRTYLDTWFDMAEQRDFLWGDGPKRVRADTDHSYHRRKKEWGYASLSRLNAEGHPMYHDLVNMKQQLFQAVVGALQDEGLSRNNIADLLDEFDNVNLVPDFMPRRV